MMKNKSVFIIAEIGVNHNGDMRIARRLIDEAKEAGANAVKFQTFKTENLVSINAKKAEYQLKTTDKKESQYLMLKSLELSKNNHIDLIRYCKNKGIKFFSSAFDEESVRLLLDLGVELIKIPSGEITNLPYLRLIGECKRKIIMSTGMATMKEIREALDILRKNDTPKRNISLLHCTTEYPTPYSEVNLKAIRTMREKFGLDVGYSDHTEGIEIPVAAVAMGAEIIEKHFTLDKKMIGPDHKASIEPKEFAEMIKSIRNVELALGDGIKRPYKEELKNMAIVRKSIIATKKIKQGEFLTEENITTKRPGTGISPMKWDKIIGSKAAKDYQEDDLI